MKPAGAVGVFLTSFLVVLRTVYPPLVVQHLEKKNRHSKVEQCTIHRIRMKTSPSHLVVVVVEEIMRRSRGTKAGQ